MRRQAGSEVDVRAELGRETANWNKWGQSADAGRWGGHRANVGWWGGEETDLVLEPSGLEEDPHRVSVDPTASWVGELALG